MPILSLMKNKSNTIIQNLKMNKKIKMKMMNNNKNMKKV